MHVDNFNPDSYLWILQECDVPYVPEEWNKLLTSYGKDRSKLTGTTIVGRYLSKMKLKQFRDYRWKDTEFLQEVANKRIEETMKRQGYEPAEIAMAIQ
jgi:predicted ArsR family transcriptional regulator